MSKVTVKDLDAKVNDLHVFFQNELGKFKSEISNIKSPEILGVSDGTDDVRIASLIKNFKYFEASVKNQLAELREQVAEIKKQSDQIQTRMDDIIQQTNRSKLIFYGIPEANSENVSETITNILKDKLNVSIGGLEIASCYRIGRKKIPDKKPRPVIVEFFNMRLKNDILSERKRFKGSKIMCTEVLSPLRYGVYRVARHKLGKDCWTNRGRIGFVFEGSIHYVTTMHQLDIIVQREDDVSNSNPNPSRNTKT